MRRLLQLGVGMNIDFLGHYRSFTDLLWFDFKFVCLGLNGDWGNNSDHFRIWNGRYSSIFFGLDTNTTVDKAGSRRGQDELAPGLTDNLGWGVRESQTAQIRLGLFSKLERYTYLSTFGDSNLLEFCPTVFMPGF